MDDPAGTSIVFDFRMQFPTPEARLRLSRGCAADPLRVDDARACSPSPPGPPALGDETHVYGLDTQGDSGPVSIRDYIFRVGSGRGQGPRRGCDHQCRPGGGHRPRGRGAHGGRWHASPRLTRARRRLRRPRPAAVPCRCRAVTWCPCCSPTSRQTSRRPASPDSQRLWEGEVVTLVCAPTDADVEVTYSGFDTADHMGAAYQSSLDTIDLSEHGRHLRRGYLLRLVPAGQRAGRPADLLAGGCRAGDHVVRRPALDPSPWRSRRRSMRPVSTCGGRAPARCPERQPW